MKYEGKLYGKTGGQYFELVDTSKDVKNLKKENIKMKRRLSSIRLMLTAHPDYRTNVEFEDQVTAINEFLESEINQES